MFIISFGFEKQKIIPKWLKQFFEKEIELNWLKYKLCIKEAQVQFILFLSV